MKKILLVLLLSVFINNIVIAKNEANKITVNTDHIITNNYYGGAVQWEPNDRDSLTNTQWDRLLKRVDFLQLGYIRCCLNDYYYCFGFSESNDPIYIWNKNDLKNIDTKWVKESTRLMDDLYKILSYCQENNIKVMLGNWGTPNGLFGVPPVVNFDRYTLNWGDPRYANLSVDLLDYLINDKKFTCITQFNLGNEVNLWPDVISWHSWSSSMKTVYNGLNKKGLLNKVCLVGPDGGYWSNLWLNETLTELDKEVSVVDYHWYILNDWLITNRIENEMRIMRFFTSLKNPKKDNIFGEIGIRDGHIEPKDQQSQIGEFWYGVSMADALVQTMRAGWSCAVAWDMDDAMHYKDDTQHQKKWGFWNSVAEQKNEINGSNIRPWFYTWSLLSRHFPPGSKVVYSNSFGLQGINSVTAITPKGDITCAIVNNRDFNHNVILNIPNVKNLIDLKKYVYFKEDKPIDEKGFPIAKENIKSVNLSEGISINLNGKGVVILTTENCKTKPIIQINNNTLYDPLDGLELIYEHSGNLGFNGFVSHYNECKESSPNFYFEHFENDKSTIHPSTDNQKAYIVYKFNNMSGFEVKVTNQDEIDNQYFIYESNDGKKWNQIKYKIKDEKPMWKMWNHATLYFENLKNCNYLKIEMDPCGNAVNTRLREIKLIK